MDWAKLSCSLAQVTLGLGAGLVGVSGDLPNQAIALTNSQPICDLTSKHMLLDQAVFFTDVQARIKNIPRCTKTNTAGSSNPRKDFKILIKGQKTCRLKNSSGQVLQQAPKSVDSLKVTDSQQVLEVIYYHFYNKGNNFKEKSTPFKNILEILSRLISIPWHQCGRKTKKRATSFSTVETPQYTGGKCRIFYLSHPPPHSLPISVNSYVSAIISSM